MGHGGAKVDLQLSQNQYTLGEIVTGDIVVMGGNVAQRINEIHVKFYVSFFANGMEHTHQLASFPFHVHGEIGAHEQRQYPFTYELPTNLLLSAHTVHYYFVTHLDIAGAVDSSDRDYVEITPPARLQQVMNSLGQLGFCEKHDSREFDGRVQEFAFAPTSFLAGKVEEVEFVATIQPEGILLQLELDAYSFLGEKEMKRQVWLENDLLDDVHSLTQHLQQVLQEMLDQPHSTHDYSHHYYDHHHHHSHSHSHGNTAMGAIGGFAAGVLAAEVLDEVFDNDDNNEEDFEADFDDFFDED